MVLFSEKRDSGQRDSGRPPCPKTSLEQQDEEENKTEQKRNEEEVSSWRVSSSTTPWMETSAECYLPYASKKITITEKNNHSHEDVEQLELSSWECVHHLIILEDWKF